MRQFRQLAEQSLLTPAPAVIISLPPTPPKGMGARTKVVISPPPTPPKGMGAKTKVTMAACLIRTKRPTPDPSQGEGSQNGGGGNSGGNDDGDE